MKRQKKTEQGDGERIRHAVRVYELQGQNERQKDGWVHKRVGEEGTNVCHGL